MISNKINPEIKIAKQTEIYGIKSILSEKNEIIEFYAKQYRQMLSDNLDDYADNFDKYIQTGSEQK